MFAAIFPPAVCDEIDPLALLNQARARIVESIRRLPKYTCVQTVRRFRFQAVAAAKGKGCGGVEDPDQRRQMTLLWTDRLKLDVTVAAGGEIFSWAGARSFQSDEVDSIVGGGMTGTGDFGPFLMSVFAANGSEYQYLGLRDEQGRSLAVYRYRVPLSASHYQVNVGPAPGDLSMMAYEGNFWIDPQTAGLSKMTIEVPDPPREAEICRAATTIEYRLSRIGGAEFVLPRLTVLEMWDMEGQRHENRVEYSACREFQTESVFRTDAAPPPGDSQAPKTPLVMPPGIAIKIALNSTIDSETAFAGDPIEGQAIKAIRDRQKRVMVPEGAIVHGRIVRLERRYKPSAYFTLGLKFHSIDVHGIETPLRLQSVNQSKESRILLGPLEKREGTGVFVFRGDRLLLDRYFISDWKTRR